MSDIMSIPTRKSKAEAARSVKALLLDQDPNNLAPESTSNILFIDELVSFAGHPFKLYEGEQLDDMVRSIKELGVIVPIIVRESPDGDLGIYEILSGHNRVNAAKLAGLKKVPAIIKVGLTDSEAKLIVTETNLVQRSFTDLSHSERAIALKTHIEAIKSQGKRKDLLSEIEKLSNPHEIKDSDTSGLLDPKNEARDIAGKKYGLDARTVSRYIRLCDLCEFMLNRVDNDEIGLYPAVSLSYLSPDEQTELDRLLTESAYKIDMKKAELLREFSEVKKLTPEKMTQILSGELNKKPKPKTAPPLKIKAKVYQKYFSGDTTQSEMETIIDQALSDYFTNHEAKEVS
ncbi:MAG: ParB/RepB/Spo0J family partition protein [Lachnospiraceae bacterium]|nr:ParB/RepB/Spo0J family partition protein [Lachnospiraceae bacterium]